MSLLDLFRRSIRFGDQKFACRLVALPQAIRTRRRDRGPWKSADSDHLDAYDEKYLPGSRPPWTPIIALGTGLDEGRVFTSVPFIGIDNRAPGVFKGGLKIRGHTTVRTNFHFTQPRMVALEVKER